MSFYRKFTIVCLLVIALVGLNYYLDFFIQDFFYDLAASPLVLTEGFFFDLTQYGRDLLHLSDVVQENKRLKLENNLLLNQLAAIENLENENELLRQQLAVTARTERQLVMAQVFSFNRNSSASTLLINKGRADGLDQSMAVVESGNVLVGRIWQVFDHSALVLLLDDPRSRVSVRVGPARVLANLLGVLAQELDDQDQAYGRLDLITVKDPVQENDLIVTSGLDGLAEALVVGRVSRVQTSSGDLFKEAEAQLLFYPLVSARLFIIK